MSETPHVVSQAPATTDVLIVGAGPTGLTLAIELARRAIPFRLIDREPTRPTTSRALGTQPRTVEVFQIMGIPEAALTPAITSLGFEMMIGDRAEAQVSLFGGGSDRSPIIMEENATEQVLEQRLALLGGQIELDTELVDYRLVDDGVVARLRAGSGATEVRTRFLVGADGAHSTVRRLAGIGFEGASYPERFLLADAELEWEFSHDRARIWAGSEGLLATLPLPNERRWRLIVSLPDDAGLPEDPSPEEIAAYIERVLQERSGVPVRYAGQPHWASAFRVHRRIADRYREGPVFLAGDAAHVHSPVGGQGMNTGIQDAFNLGWKLALAARNLAAPGLLDTYGAERRPVAQEVLRGTDLATRVLLGRNPLARTFRERAMPALSKITPLRDRLMHLVAELGVGYRESPLSIDAESAPGAPERRKRQGLRAGDRVPDGALLTMPQQNPVSLFTLIAQGWVMLLIPGDRPSPERIESLHALARETRLMVGSQAPVFLISRDTSLNVPGIPALLDVSGEVSRTFGTADELVVLVRPDGYLGYRGFPEQRLELSSYLARVFAMRLRGLEADETH